MPCSCRKNRKPEEPSRRKRQHHDDLEHNQEPTEWTGFEGYEWANEWHRNQRGPMNMTVGEVKTMRRKANPSWWRSDEEPETYGRNFYVEPDDQIRVQDILDEFDDLLDIQLSPGNWDFDPYLHGMLNGMLLMRAIVSGETPEYMEAPEQWGTDLYDERQELLDDEYNLECSAGFRDGVRLARDIAGDHHNG